MSSTIHAKTRQVLAMVAATGSVGILRTDLRLHFAGDGSLGKRLDNLVNNGYVIKKGNYNESRFFATAKQPAEVAADPTAAAAADPEEQMRDEARRKAPKGVPPGVPSSVFHLGQMHAQAQADAAEPEATAAAPAPAPAADAAPAGPFAMEPLRIPTLRPLREQLVLRQSAAAAPQGEVFKPPTPHFELHSDGVLVIDPAGDGTEPISLPPTLTRHLFRWLDQLSGLHLSRLVAAEATDEAAS